MAKTVAGRGFTLVEVLVTLTLLSVLAVLAAPALAGMGQRAQMRGLASAFLGDIYHARSEAIKRNARVVLCNSADGRRCAPSGGWEQGWILFHDEDNDGVRGPEETLIRATPALPPGWRLDGNATMTRHISFDGSGGTRHVSGAFQAGTLTLCHVSPTPTVGRQLVISANGRPRLREMALEQC